MAKAHPLNVPTAKNERESERERERTAKTCNAHNSEALLMLNNVSLSMDLDEGAPEALAWLSHAPDWMLEP